MFNFSKRMASTKRKGFTLVELVVVILIIAILAAAIFLGGATVIKQARERQVMNDLKNFGSYVQDMLYENPKLQYHNDYDNQEWYSFDSNDDTFDYQANAKGSTAPAAVTDATDLSGATGMTVLSLLNDEYLTDDFQLGDILDAWDNPYVFSYDQLRSADTGDSSSCIIVINSLGVNSLDESSDRTTDTAVPTAQQIAKMFVTNMKDTSIDADLAADQHVYASAQEYIDLYVNPTLEGAKVDDYGIVIVMIDGQVSVGYYGF